MELFRVETQQRSEASRRLYARFELVYTAVDFSAALAFLFGSIMFFSPDWQYPAIWLFVVGSVLFATKPTIRLIREIALYRMGDIDDLAQRVE